jgi:hypothetical protein
MYVSSMSHASEGSTDWSWLANSLASVQWHLCTGTISLTANSEAQRDEVDGCNTPTMITKTLPIAALVANTVHFPRLAKLATRTPISGTTALVVHFYLPDFWG